MSDSIYALTNGKAMPKRFYDLIHPQPSAQTDDRPPDEIANDILSAAGVEVVHQ
jgi:hypothetical protein